MKQNKSIDGLTTRDAKTASSSKNAQKTIKVEINDPFEPNDPLVAKSSEEKPAEDRLALDDAPDIHITIEDDLTTKVEPLEDLDELQKPEKPKKSPARPEQSAEDFLSPIQAFDFDGKNLTPAKGTNKEEENTMNKDVNNKSIKSPKKDKDGEKPKQPGKTRRIITIVALVIVLALIGVVLWAVFWGNDIIAKITGGQGNVFDLLTFVEDTYEPLKTDANGRTNILAFGTSGFNMEGESFDGTHDGASLTDSIMMISLDQTTGDIAMLSLPRDLKASPTCTATGKINEVYWCNNMYDDDEAAGAAALMAEVGSILGVDFQYYAHLNWGSLVYIVDTLGGITITLDEDIDDEWWTGAVFEAGVPYTINGADTLGLARARHGTIGGDFSRGASQQKILIGIKNKLFENDLSITDMLGLASNLGDNLRTNFSISDLKTLAHLTWEFDFNSMRTLSLYPEYMTTGTLDNGISYVFPSAGVGNYGAIQEYVAAELAYKPPIEVEELPEESATE